MEVGEHRTERTNGARERGRRTAAWQSLTFEPKATPGREVTGGDVIGGQGGGKGGLPPLLKGKVRVLPLLGSYLVTPLSGNFFENL